MDKPRLIIKILIASLLTVALALSPLMGAYVAGTRAYAIVADTPSDWAREEVYKAREFGLIPNNMYHSFLANITRLEFCRLVMALYTKITAEPERMITQQVFTDTNNISVLNAYELGIVKGVGEGRFAPTSAITRQEMALMLYNTIGAIQTATGKNILQNTSSALTFVDLSLSAEWAVDAIKSLRNNEIMLGDDKGRFNPLDITTKEMAFILIKRIYLIYSGLDAKKAFPAAYTGEIMMRVKGVFNSGENYQIIGDIYEFYPEVSGDDLDRYLGGEAFIDGGGALYLVNRSESLSESVAAGYTGGAGAGGQYYPVYVLEREGSPQNRIYIINRETRYELFSDSGGSAPFMQKTFSDVIFNVPADTAVDETMDFTGLYRDEPERLDSSVWLVQLTRGGVTRMNTLSP